jgi:hypothetical protein
MTQQAYEALSARVAQDLDTSAFKNTLIEHQESFSNFMIAQDVIKKYIQSHDCILYGGTAIDYALRLRGDKIYEDGEIPDFDFWTPNYIEVAYEILGILSTLMPGVNIYGTRAMFIRTMRISVGDNGWVADVSFIPRELFDRMPVLIYDGMRIVHPHAQFCDLHSSLSYPYDSAPREVVFARWKKDIERFNKLFAAYPFDETITTSSATTKQKPPLTLAQVAVPHEIISHSVLHGFAAYSLYYNLFASTDEVAISAPSHPRAPRISDDTLIVDVPFDLIEVRAHRDVIARHTAAKSPRKFYPLMDFLDPLSVASVSGATLMAYSTYGHPTSYHSFSISRSRLRSQSLSQSQKDDKDKDREDPKDQMRIRAVSIHGLLKHFIAGYICAKFFNRANAGPTIGADVYLSHYISCLAMIRKGAETPAIAQYFAPSLTAFGEITIPLHDLISTHGDILHIIEPSRLSREVLLPPKNIRIRASNQALPPPFKYDACEFLRISGEEKLT